MKPTEQQQLIIDHPKNAVVIAAPGSGKTFVLSKKIKIDLSSLHDHQGVIAISYTNKASNELKNRSLSNGEDPKSSFFGTIDKFNISEIVVPFGKHLFGIPCADINVITLQALDNEEKELFSWLGEDFTQDEFIRNHLKTVVDYFTKGKIIIETVGVFSDYIFNNSLACRNYIKARYVKIYIDEYQDSGYYQHKMFLSINELNIEACAVGDLNQSIYAFSGKDSKFLSELTTNEEFQYFNLSKNHRCHASIINYSNYLLNPRTELIPVDKMELIHVLVSGKEEQIANWIDNKIKTILKSFNVEKRNEVAILTRGNRTASIINKNLKSPSKIFHSNALDLNLNIWSSIFSNLFYYVYDPSHKFIDVVEIFTSYEKFSKSDLKKLKFLKDKLDIVAKSESIKVVDLRSLFISTAETIAPNSENFQSIELLDSVLKNEEELSSYKPAKENEINILTLHKSKGLEFDIVLHLDLYEWILPNKKPGPNNDFDNLIYGNWDQDLNLHYVGITRAKKGCIFITSTKRTNYKNLEKNAKDSEFLTLNNINKLRRK